MGKRGKLDWDQAMLESGHRTTENKNKKWASRLRTSTKNKNVIDSITREQILNERLDALERDNIEDEEAFNESDLYDEDEDDLVVQPKRRKETSRVKSLTVLPVFKFAKVVFQDKSSKEIEGKPSYVSAASKPSRYPARKFCSICGNVALYKCLLCGSIYCSYECKKCHEETKCITMK